MANGDVRARPRLSRREQRYNYGLAIGAVAVVVLLIVASPTVMFEGQRAPVLLVALLVGAFLFGLGQMIIGIVRRRTYLRTSSASSAGGPTSGHCSRKVRPEGSGRRAGAPTDRFDSLSWGYNVCDRVH